MERRGRRSATPHRLTAMPGKIKPVEFLPPLYPIDGTAARVVSQKGETWEPTLKLPPGYYRSETPPKLRSLETKGGLDLRGQRFGKLVVIGLSDEVPSGQSRKKYALWAVRCDCGFYEHRSARALRNGICDGHKTPIMCAKCSRVAQIMAGENRGLLEAERASKQRKREREIAIADAINKSKAVKSFVQRYANAKRPGSGKSA